MGTMLSDVLKKAGLEVNEDVAENEEQVSLHRTKNVIERPTEEVTLNKVYQGCIEVTKTQSDPTEDLVFIEPGLEEEEFKKFLTEEDVRLRLGGLLAEAGIELSKGYIIYDVNTFDTFIAPTEKCLNANFIFREDLIIKQYEGFDGAYECYKEMGGKQPAGVLSRKTCYILDNPADETYEVYYDSTYPSRVYGQATPKGCFVHKYKNRFHRDMAILTLDATYTVSSKKMAQKLTKKKMGENEAIVISDGAYMKDSITSAVVYIDNQSVFKLTQGTLASEKEQSVLIAEINGAYNALKMCQLNKKTKITYYYDNTSILNVFKNRKTEYIEEIKRYKDLLINMSEQGYSVEFIEVHPKTDENKKNENQAVLYFHNRCDDECREMCELYSRDYVSYVQSNNKKGQDFKDFRRENTPKGKPKNNGGGNFKPRR